MIWLYRLAFLPLFVLSFPYYAWRMLKRGGYAKDFSHRFGCQENLPKPADGKKRIWIQSVSVGETEAIAPLIKKLHGRGDVELVITTTTSTAYKILREKYAQYCLYCGVFPLDFLPFSARAWKKIKPDLCVLMESELWPEHLHQAKRRGVKVLLVNARLSDRSYRRYSRVKFIAARLLSKLDRILASSEGDAQRFRELCLGKVEVSAVGNIKFDSVPDRLLSDAEKLQMKKDFGFEENSFVLLGSSTWPTEEEMLISALKKIRETGADARLLLIPRHAERRAEIIRALDVSKLPYRVRTVSKIAEAGNMVYLADTTGELRVLTQIADLSFVGKSLPPNMGGQTPIDCAQLCVPLTYGPNMTNFRLICKALEECEGAIKTRTPEEEISELVRISQDAGARKTLSANAKAWHTSNLGSVQKICDAILRALKLS